MESLYKYARITPIRPFVASITTGSGLFLFPGATKSLRRASVVFSTLSLSVSMIISYIVFWQLINGSPIHKIAWSWISYKDLSLDLGFSIDPLASIMLVLVTTVGVSVTIYSASYMSHDRGYVRFFAYLSLFMASMLGLVSSSNLIQIYIFRELVGMCSYLLIGFWFARPSAANACQKAFVVNRAGDFGFLLGILGIFWVTGSFDTSDISDRFNELITKDEINLFFANACTILLFMGPMAKSAQFPLHVWLPDAMEGPTPVSAPIHAATMVAAGIFLVARMFHSFEALPFTMSFISCIGALTALLGATIATAQKDLKKGLAYSTMSQLGYMVLALGIGSYRSALFHLITHAFTKALLFLGSGSVIHSMEPIVGYSPDKCQDMTLMGGLRTYMPITGITFLLGTLSLCGIPPFACFWSKDEILADSWSYSPILGTATWFTAGLTAFYMFRIYFLTFEGNFRASTSVNAGGNLSPSSHDLLPGGVPDQKNIVLEPVQSNVIPGRSFDNIENSDSSFSFGRSYTLPKESDYLMLIPLIILAVPTTLLGFAGSPLSRGESGYDLISDYLNVFPEYNTEMDSKIWVNLIADSLPPIIATSLGIIISYSLYGPFSSRSREYVDLEETKIMTSLPNFINDWSYYRGYIDDFYSLIFVNGTRIFAKRIYLFDRWVIDGIVNAIGASSISGGEGARYGGGGRIYSYLTGLIIGLALLLILALQNTGTFQYTA
uniref:NAD(P)H-quinone oxidoreductase subunit 5, chloroplastic n=2 Tax=Ophioglossum TaxID=13833 RepID=L7SZJ5_9MONI|nr:NAD(P)H-quinone oxidoreductase subunit 5 [Ophioglossum californicum]AGC26755.1 NAD(P)H-quinone oxidoreductase subunit 5 [Ophioglossum californicum]QXF60128.1 NADH dehydrogenase subunit 5 [Ophioglossum vulgatum]